MDCEIQCDACCVKVCDHFVSIYPPPPLLLLLLPMGTLASALSRLRCLQSALHPQLSFRLVFTSCIHSSLRRSGAPIHPLPACALPVEACYMCATRAATSGAFLSGLSP
jgi:hypothetical protein